MTKIVFLDIDGTSLPLDRSLTTKVHERISFLLAATEAKIVFSSDWRRNPGLTPSQLLDKLVELADTNWLSDRHLFSPTNPELGFTPIHDSHDHTTEIREFVLAHNIESFCVLDDVESSEFLKNNWVHVDYRDGVTWRDVAKASIILNGNCFEVEQKFW